VVVVVVLEMIAVAVVVVVLEMIAVAVVEIIVHHNESNLLSAFLF
jgi:hypothetical protein